MKATAKKFLLFKDGIDICITCVGQDGSRQAYCPIILDDITAKRIEPLMVAAQAAVESELEKQ